MQNPDRPPVYLSVIVPAYKSAGILEKNLPVLQSWLKTQAYSWEIIVVDDGSDDQGATKNVAESAGCVFYQNPENMGKGAAVRNGMIHAKGHFRIFTDADIPYETETIERMLKYLDYKEFDMVVGDRNMHDSAYFTEIPRLRRITSAFFTWFVGTIVTTNYFDTQCGIKGFTETASRFIFQRSRLNGFAFDVELIYLALKQNLEIKRVPVKLRNQEKSTVRVIRHGTTMFFDLFRIKYYNMKGYYRQ